MVVIRQWFLLATARGAPHVQSRTSRARHHKFILFYLFYSYCKSRALQPSQRPKNGIRLKCTTSKAISVNLHKNIQSTFFRTWNPACTCRWTAATCRQPRTTTVKVSPVDEVHQVVQNADLAPSLAKLQKSAFFQPKNRNRTVSMSSDIG